MAINDVGIRITATDATAAGVRSAMAGLQGLQGAAGGINKALASIGAGLSVSAFVAYTKSIIDGIDALNDLKDATGASIENISALEDVARRSGASMDTVGTSLVKLNQALAAAKPGSPAEAAIKAIGLSVKDLKALDPAEAFRRIAVGLDGFADDANKARLTQELFGKSLKEVAPLLKDLATQGALNATVTTAQAEEAEKFNKQLSALQKNVVDASRSLVSEMVPALNEVFAAMRSGGLMKGLDELGNQLFDWDGNNARKEIRNLTAEIDTLREAQALITADIFGRRGAIQADIDAKINALKAAKDAYFKLTNGSAGAGRGSVNPAPVETRATLADISGATTKTTALSEAQKLVNAGLKLYNDLMAESSGYSKTFTEDVTALAAAYQRTGMSAQEYAAALNGILAAQPGAKEAEKARLDAARANTQAVDDLFDAQEKLRTANEDQIKTGRTMLEQIEYETRILGLNAEQRAMAALERELETQGIIKGTQAYDAYIAKLREATAIKTAKEAGIKSTEDLAEANKKAAEESSKYWEDALMRAFESGKGFFQSLWDTIKNTLKTQVPKVLVTGSISGLGLTGAANAATGSAGILSSLSNLPSTISSLATAVTSLPSLLSSSSMGALDILGFNPWVAAGAALLAVVANLDKGETRAGGQYGYSTDGSAVLNNRRGTFVEANGVIGAIYLEGPSGGDPYGDVAKMAINSTVLHINDLFKAMGSTTAIAAFQAGYESSEKGRGGVFAGGTLTNGGVFGDSGAGDNYSGTLYDSTKGFSLDAKQAIEAFSLDLKQATIEALQAATDIPKVIADMIKGDAQKLSDEAATALLTSIDALVNDVVGLRGALDTLPFASLRDLSFDAAAGLIAASGNLEALANNLAGYYENFYSESEKTANLTSVLATQFAALGQTMPTDNLREWYRTQVEIAMAADQSVPANAALTASLLSMQGGVSTLAKTSEDAAKAALDAAAAQKKQTEENIAATLGFDASGLSEMILTAALNPEAGMTAAQAFSETLEETIRNTLISNTVSSISQSIFDSIITPMMLGQAVSDATLDEITAAATARLEALDALFQSEDFQTGLQNILTSVSTTVAGLGGFGSTTSAAAAVADQPFVQYLDQVVAAVDPIAAALEAVADRIAALQPKDTAATRAAEIAAALAQYGSDGTYVDTYITGGGKGGGDIGWVKEFIASNENAVTRALTELYKLEDQRKAQDAARSIISIQGELAKYLGDKSMANGVLQWNRADTLAQLNEQDPSGQLAGEQVKLWDAKVIYDYNRALLEASGDTAGLAAFDKAANEASLIMEGWSQEQIDALSAAQTQGANQGWQDKIDVLTGATTERQLQYTKDLAAATDATTKALVDQYYAQLDINEAATKAAELAKTNAGLQDQLDVLTGSRTQQEVDRANALAAATDDSTKALMLQIYAQQDLAAAAAQAAELAKTNGELEERLAVLKGDSTQQEVDRARELAAATDDSTKSLLLQIYAQEDLADAAAKSAELAKTNAGWQDQLDVLMGTRTQQEVDRQNTIAQATDASTIALMEQVFAQQDLAAAAEEAAAAQQAISDERKGLQEQLNALTDTEAQALERQRNALDESNRALFDQVQAAEAAKAALDAFNSAMENAAQTQASLQVDLLNAQGDTAGATALQRQQEIDAATAGMTGDYLAQVIAAMEANYELADSIAAITAAAELAATNADLQSRLDVLKGESTQQEVDRARELAAATDESTKALLLQIYAQEDLADAATKAAELAKTNAGWQDQLDVLTGARTQQEVDRQNAIAQATDASTIALMEQVFAQQDLAAAAQAAAELAKTNQGVQDQIDVLSGTRTQTEVDRQNALAAATDESTKALMLHLYALQDEAAAAQKAAELAKVNAGWQSQLDVLLGDKTQKEVDRAAALAEVTDESTRALMLQVYAQQDMAEAATTAIDAMKALSAEMDQIADFRSSIGDAQQNIRSQMVGYDAVAYGKAQVEKYTAQLAGATTTQGRVDAGAGLRDAITGRYNAELELINKNRSAAEESARAAFDAQTNAQNAAIQSANELNAAYRQIGEYVKGLITGADAPYSLASRYAAAQADYSTTLALANAGDKDAIGRITGAQGALLSTAKEQSVSSVDYARVFGRTINDLSKLAAKAGPDLEQVTRQFYFDSSTFDQQALDLQTSTIAELEDLATLTDEWTADLQDQMAEQALAFANIGLNTAQTADYTSKIEPGFERVAVAIDSAIQAQNYQASLLAEIQGLRQEVAGLRRATDVVGVNTKATADTLDSVSGGGGPLLVQTA